MDPNGLKKWVPRCLYPLSCRLHNGLRPYKAYFWSLLYSRFLRHMPPAQCSDSKTLTAGTRDASIYTHVADKELYWAGAAIHRGSFDLEFVCGTTGIFNCFREVLVQYKTLCEKSSSLGWGVARCRNGVIGISRTRLTIAVVHTKNREG